MDDFRYAFNMAFPEEGSTDPNVGGIRNLGRWHAQLRLLHQAALAIANKSKEGSVEEEKNKIPLAVVEADGSWDAIAEVVLDVVENTNGEYRPIVKIDAVALRALVIGYLEGHI